MRGIVAQRAMRGVGLTPELNAAGHGRHAGEDHARGGDLEEPRTGGVILARGPVEELEALVAQDPFVEAGVASYEFTSILVSRTARGFEALKD